MTGFTAFNAKATPSNNLLRRDGNTFVAKPTPEGDGFVLLALLFRQSDARTSIFQTEPGLDGRNRETSRMLAQVVGIFGPETNDKGEFVVNDKGESQDVPYPDFTGDRQFPHIDSPAYDELMGRKSPIKVRCVYAAGLEKLRQYAKAGKVPGLSAEHLADVEASNGLNNLLNSMGAVLRRLPGVVSEEFLTYGQLMSTLVTVQLTMLDPLEKDAFREDFATMRSELGFNNVCLYVTVGCTWNATQLTPRGERQTTYTPSSFHFEWTMVPGDRGMQVARLSRAHAISGNEFALGTSSDSGLGDAMQTDARARERGARGNVDQKRGMRDFQKKGSMINAFDGTVKPSNGAGVPAGMVEIDEAL